VPRTFLSTDARYSSVALTYHRFVREGSAPPWDFEKVRDGTMDVSMYARIGAGVTVVGVFILLFLLPTDMVSAQQGVMRIVPECPATGCRACDLVKLANNVMEFIIFMSVIIAVLLIAYTGFQYVIGGGSSSELLHLAGSIIGGIVLMLCGWLIVDTVFKYLVGNQEFGVWNSIECKNNPEFAPYPEQAPGAPSVYTPPNYTGEGQGQTDTETGQPVQNLGRGDCSPESIKAAAAAGGYTLTDSQARVMSCISSPESGCQLGARNDTSSATGVFQITMGHQGSQCHGLNIPACTQAAQSAGFSVSGNLNCYNAFGAGGTVKPGQESLADACRAAASNFNCNTAAAACLLQNRPDYGDWTNPGRPGFATQRACVSQYGGR
jgi:hypothetical protein